MIRCITEEENQRVDFLYHCDFCDKDFEKGHKCWCKECNKPHPMCNKCYKEAIDSGAVIDKVIPRNSMTETNKEKYT